MQVYLKIHSQGGTEVIAVCDNDLLNKELCEDNFKLKISNDFYGGKLIDIDEAINLLAISSNFNIIGNNIIRKAIKSGIINESIIKKINNIPLALKMIF
ncbi:MAG: DUF424 family protein [Candidatus Lokiarchaeota archaeon]|nr:DUF424 family protein [Candidatus Lokiarchaeota archaeon]